MQDLKAMAPVTTSPEPRRLPLPDITVLGWVNRLILGIATVALLVAMALMV